MGRLEQWLKAQNQPSYRFKQVVDLYYQGRLEDWEEITAWPKKLRQAIARDLPIRAYSQSQVFTSTDGTKKAALILNDGQVIETVLMEPKPGLFSVCVSCEVGCPMRCAFCATGQMGFKRLPSAEEIVEQYLFWVRLTQKQGLVKPSHLVFMGMGEPLHNRTQVFESIRVLADKQKIGLSNRHLSVSTSGVMAGIKAMADEFPQLNLAISLHAADQPLRDQLMPVSKAHSLSDLQDSLKYYLKKTRRQVMFEYLLLAGINDNPQAISRLKHFWKGFDPKLVHLNLIRYNPTGTQFTQPSKNHVFWFKRQLQQAGISVSIRKNLGIDIDGACGQLAAKTTT